MEKIAKLRFVSHKFVETHIIVNPDVDPESELHINIDSNATDNKGQNTMKLDLITTVNDNPKNVDIKVVVSAIFMYDKELSAEAKEGFFKYNAPAIVFPFVRAYINSLTALSGIKPIVLPTINFSPVK